jgi:hypothetical protein
VVRPAAPAWPAAPGGAAPTTAPAAAPAAAVPAQAPPPVPGLSPAFPAVLPPVLPPVPPPPRSAVRLWFRDGSVLVLRPDDPLAAALRAASDALVAR